MKVGIYYFSGSGNTKWLSEQLEQILSQSGHDVNIQSIEAVSAPRENDLVILGGPIYAGNVPEKLIRWTLRNIPQAQSAKAVVFTTSAGLENANGIHSLGRKLINKGYQLTGAFTYALPRNYYFGNYAPTPADTARGQFARIKASLSADVEKILRFEAVSVQEKVLSLDLFAELMSIMSRFMGKSFSVTDECICCGLCVKNCPTQNIVMDKKIRWKTNCMLCTRCIHNCPAHAIQYKRNQYPQYQVKHYITQDVS